MFLVYIDEAGDDGYPNYTTPIFVLTACYFDNNSFQTNYDKLYLFKKRLKEKYSLPIKTELHLRELIQNKKPYAGLNLGKENRKNIVEDIFNFISSEDLDIKFINVLIEKSKISSNGYNVLEEALKYLLQRIENDLSKSFDKPPNFLCIADKGRVGTMNKIARAIRRVNFVPSAFGGSRGNNPIKCLIEDILEKDSKESHFIQLSDCVTRLIYLYAGQNLCDPKINWTKKTKKFIKESEVEGYLNLIKPKLNLKACGRNEYGIVHYPK